MEAPTVIFPNNFLTLPEQVRFNYMLYSILYFPLALIIIHDSFKAISMLLSPKMADSTEWGTVVTSVYLAYHEIWPLVGLDVLIETTFYSSLTGNFP